MDQSTGQKRTAAKRDIPLVSVVVTTRNEKKNIGNCLRSIAAQDWPSVEIIVVDNASTDETKEIAREFTDKVFDKGPERSAQRNFGMIDKSEGDYAIYVDADMILAPTLLSACVEHIQETGAVALHVPEIVLGTNYFSQVRRYERGFYDGTPVDGARFFDRENFIKAGGFDAPLFVKGSGEDWDIDKSVKQFGSIELLPRRAAEHGPDDWPMREFVEERGVRYRPDFCGIYHNESEFVLGQYLRKKSYYSVGFDGYIEKWGRDDPDIKRQFGLTYRFWTVFTENGKWRRLLAAPHLAFGMYFLRVCVGLVFLLKSLGIAGSVAPSR